MNKISIDLFSVLLTIATLCGVSIMGFSGFMLLVLLRTPA